MKCAYFMGVSLELNEAHCTNIKEIIQLALLLIEH
jgi:hypothetical protein